MRRMRTRRFNVHAMTYNPRMRKTSLVALSLLFVFASAALAQVADGDSHWAMRAEGHSGARAKADHVNAAIAAYQRAVTANPNALDARYKLLRAYRFKGAYVATSTDDKKAIYNDAKKAGESAMSVLDAQLRAKGITSVTKATEKQVADAARAIPHAGEVFLWDAINWGEWALVYGKLAAVKEGAADRIKREATIAMLVDPKLEGGSPARVLGRLHDQTPRVPFITGWASSKDAVKYLNESLKVDPTNKITRVFLAEAMVSNNSDTKPQAIQMLRETVSAPNNPEFEVEQSAATDDARALLKKWGA
jgi:tetratricopeptide (TPR) repeat protein